MRTPSVGFVDGSLARFLLEQLCDSGLNSEILRKDLNVKKHFVDFPQRRRGPLNNYEDHVNPPDVHPYFRGKMQHDISGINCSINTAAAKNNPTSNLNADAKTFIPTSERHLQEPYQAPIQHAPIMYPHAVGLGLYTL